MEETAGEITKKVAELYNETAGKSSKSQNEPDDKD